MRKHSKVIIISLLIVLLFLGFLKWTNIKIIENLPKDYSCKNAEFSVPVTLQSGEQGVLFITDNHCEISPVGGYPPLAFDITNDGAVKNNVSQSVLHIWKLNNQLPIETVIHNIITTKFKKDSHCQVKQNDTSQFDKLITYGVYPDQKNSKLKLEDCLIFVSDDSLSSEYYFATNNLLIMSSQYGSWGIQPYDETSIRFEEK